MAPTLRDLSKALTRRETWGPFLILVGAYLLFSSSLKSGDSSLINNVRLVLAGLMIVCGLIVMFYQLREDDGTAFDSTSPSSEPEYIIGQLSRNYELLRQQTTQGFILSGVFMALGFLVILAGSAGNLFGITKDGTNLTSVAGVIMEFISGTSLLVYRLNFKRLNQTTDKLDSAWRVLAAHKLSANLPEDVRNQATLMLIQALLGSSARETGLQEAIPHQPRAIAAATNRKE